VDTVGKTGPPRESPTATAIAEPELADPQVTKVEDAEDTYRFQVTYRHAGEADADRVRLVLDGTSISMEPVEGHPDEGTTYGAEVDVAPHSPSGAHSYRFVAETSAPPASVSLPENGNFTGPMASTLDGTGSTAPVPLGPSLAALAMLAAALIVGARSRRP
jgi:hypothetical protein